jgi:hypothetical protein
MGNLWSKTMEIEWYDIFIHITIPSAIQIQHIIREATKSNMELLKLYLLLNKTLFKKYTFDIRKEMLILHQ